MPPGQGSKSTRIPHKIKEKKETVCPFPLFLSFPIAAVCTYRGDGGGPAFVSQSAYRR